MLHRSKNNFARKGIFWDKRNKTAGFRLAVRMAKFSYARAGTVLSSRACFNTNQAVTNSEMKK